MFRLTMYELLKSKGFEVERVTLGYYIIGLNRDLNSDEVMAAINWDEEAVK